MRFKGVIRRVPIACGFVGMGLTGRCVATELTYRERNVYIKEPPAPELGNTSSV